MEEAVERERREGMRALRAATNRASVERRTLLAEVEELEETTEELSCDIQEAIADNRAFRGVVQTRAARLEVELKRERQRTADLTKSLKEAQSANANLQMTNLAAKLAWSIEMKTTENDLHESKQRVATLTYELEQERARLRVMMRHGASFTRRRWRRRCYVRRRRCSTLRMRMMRSWRVCVTR